MSNENNFPVQQPQGGASDNSANDLFDMGDLQTIPTPDGMMCWLPYKRDGGPARIDSIPTVLGQIFRVERKVKIDEALAPVRKEIEAIEKKRPVIDIRGFFYGYLPLLFLECLQDAARQALREAYAIVKAKGTMDYQQQRSKFLESVADEARQDSLHRFRMANLYRPLRRGEKVKNKATMEESIRGIIEKFFGEKELIKNAIRALLEEGVNPIPRSIARKMNLGTPSKERAKDTGIKKVEQMLKRLFTGHTPTQAIKALVEELSEEGGKTNDPGIFPEENEMGKDYSSYGTKSSRG